MLKQNNIYKFELAITNFNWNLLNYDNEMCINDTFKKIVNDLSILYNKTCPLITNKPPRKCFLNKPGIQLENVYLKKINFLKDI